MWRATLTVIPERPSRLQVAIPPSLEATIVGEGGPLEAQTAFAATRRFDTTAQAVTVAPGVTLRGLKLTTSGVSVTVDEVQVALGGAAVAVRGSVMTAAGDVVDQTSFTGQLSLEEEPGGAALQLVSRRRSGALRPFDELEVRIEQPLSAADLGALRVLVDGAPLAVTVAAGNQPLKTRFTVTPAAFLPPGASLTLSGAVGRSGRTLRVPSTPQAKVEVVTQGWQFAAFERKSEPRASFGDVTPAHGATLLPVIDGATAWRPLEVPANAKQLTVWVRAIAATGRAAAATDRAKVTLFTAPGVPVVLVDAVASTPCRADSFSFCGEWVQLSHDVTGLRGKTLYLEVSSHEASFFEPVRDGFLVAEPAFAD